MKARLSLLIAGLCFGTMAFAALKPERVAELRTAQVQRVDAALKQVTAEPTTAPRVFFVGFAGDGNQKVFAEEISLVAKRVNERYGTARRQVLLVNDQRDFDAHPFATSSSLERALKGIGALMNRERDVLFLALSSHGTPDGLVVVSNPDLFDYGMSSDAVERMLDEAGIVNRVIVVSACFSGHFVKPLRNDDSIIITAAAKNRASFGCSDERDLTYFGEAFFRDAWTRGTSLREVFTTARTAIAAREKLEGIRPASRPQAHFGKALEKKLAGLERR
jgi:hypothetical protein